MATKTINLTDAGCYFSNSNISSYGANNITTSAISGGGTAKLVWFFDWDVIFGIDNVTINKITLKYKAVSNRSLSTYKQATVRTGYTKSYSTTDITQVYEYVQSTAREGKTPTSYTDTFDGSVWNTNNFVFNVNGALHTGTGLYMITHNPGSFNIIVYYTEVSVTIDYTIKSYTTTVVASPENGGTVTGGGTHEAGTVITLTATPADGYKFVSWSFSWTPSLSSQNPETLYVQRDGTVTANFEKDVIDKILIGGVNAKAIYYTESNKTITFIVDEDVSSTTTGFNTVDDYHFAVSKTIPSGSVEVTGVLAGTTYIYKKE